jgi:hypothetical protein
MLRVKAARLVKARLVNQAKIVPTVVAAELQSRIGRNDLEEIEIAETWKSWIVIREATVASLL